MSYKLLALDLDDTLLNGQSQISARNRQAISEAIQQGVLVTIATGRMFVSARPYARQLGIELPIITYHGALIKEPGSGKEIWHRPVSRELACEIVEEAEGRGFHVNIYREDSLYAREENEYTRYYEKLASVKVNTVGELVPFLEQAPEGPTKLTIIDWDGRIQGLEEKLSSIHGDKLTILQSLSYFLEVTDAEATKGQALHRFSERYGVCREQVVAIGDSYNDLDMIEYAGLGVAMANARAEVRDVADLITKTNLEDGVAAVIEEYIL